MGIENRFLFTDYLESSWYVSMRTPVYNQTLSLAPIPEPHPHSLPPAADADHTPQPQCQSSERTWFMSKLNWSSCRETYWMLLASNPHLNLFYTVFLRFFDMYVITLALILIILTNPKYYINMIHWGNTFFISFHENKKTDLICYLLFMTLYWNDHLNSDQSLWMGGDCT